MSRRRNFLTIKEWEIEGLRKLIEQLVIKIPTATRYEFYYSFQLPKLGKEFDLLRISEDYVVNIELTELQTHRTVGMFEPREDVKNYLKKEGKIKSR